MVLPLGFVKHDLEVLAVLQLFVHIWAYLHAFLCFLLCVAYGFVDFEDRRDAQVFQISVASFVLLCLSAVSVFRM